MTEFTINSNKIENKFCLKLQEGDVCKIVLDGSDLELVVCEKFEHQENEKYKFYLMSLRNNLIYGRGFQYKSIDDFCDHISHIVNEDFRIYGATEFITSVIVNGEDLLPTVLYKEKK